MSYLVNRYVHLSEQLPVARNIGNTKLEDLLLDIMDECWTDMTREQRTEAESEILIRKGN